MKSMIYAFSLLFVTYSVNAGYRVQENADFTLKCNTQESGLVSIKYLANQLRSEEQAQLLIQDTNYTLNMDKTYFSHTVSSYLNPITGQLQYTYHGRVQFQSVDGDTYGRIKFYSNNNINENSTTQSLYLNRENIQMNVSLSLRQGKDWETFKGLCSLSYIKL
jgi:hypothetical protein